MWLKFINVLIFRFTQAYFYHKECAVGHFGQGCTNISKDTCAGCNNVNGLFDTGSLPRYTLKSIYNNHLSINNTFIV